MTKFLTIVNTYLLSAFVSVILQDVWKFGMIPLGFAPIPWLTFFLWTIAVGAVRVTMLYNSEMVQTADNESALSLENAIAARGSKWLSLLIGWGVLHLVVFFVS